MTLGQHLIELRSRMLVSASAVAIASLIGWFLSDLAWDALRLPLTELKLEGRNVAIQHIDVSSGFETRAKISFYIGTLLSMPIWLGSLWGFFAPAFGRKARRVGIVTLLLAIPLFSLGLYAGWRVMPNMVRLLSEFQPNEDAFQLNARTYVDFAVRFTLTVGFGFVAPVFLTFLNRLGVLSGRTVLQNWRLATLLICVFAAVATPAADLLSMAILALPLELLYWVAVGLCFWHDRSVQRRQLKFDSHT